MSADAINDDWWLEGGEEQPGVKQDRKRKATAAVLADELGGTKQKRRRRKKSKLEDIAPQQAESFASQHTGKRQREELSLALQPQLKGRLTPVEADELKLKKSFFMQLDSSDDDDAPSLSAFVERAYPDLHEQVKRLKDNGSPLVVVLASSAVRAVELRREMAGLTGSHPIAKLFAKHVKVEDQSVFLSDHITPIGVSTPARLKKLLDMGALKPSELKLIVVDWYWRDLKLRRFCEIPELWQSFTELYLSHIYKLLKAKQTKLALF